MLSQSADHRMDDLEEKRPARKFAAVPPITIHRSSPCPPQPHGEAVANNGCILPQISPQRTVLSGGLPSLGNGHASNSPEWHATNGASTFGAVHVKAEPASNGYHPCALQKDVQFHKPRFHHLGPMTTNAASQHRLLTNGSAFPVQSPTMSDISSICFSPHAPFAHHHVLSRVPSNDFPTKHCFRAQNSHTMRTPLPPVSGMTGDTADLEGANPSFFYPPLPSLSPYLVSGISDTPSFPSTVSPRSSAHMSRKRALSSSPLSDLVDFNSFIRNSPNSLVTLLNGTTPLSPNASTSCSTAGVTSTTNGGSGSIGHLVGHSTYPGPASALQCTIERRKTSIELNHNKDGSTNTTITNQITLREPPQPPPVSMEVDGPRGSNLVLTAAQNGYENQPPRSLLPGHTHLYHLKEELADPHICLWDTCGQKFEELDDLVQHIESAHIEKGKLDDFTCMWQSCPRRRKPFNARYKLLIHMRIHSGEKPNKCTYLGCTKAFSRLENLKIHLRTHTGEKPYVCQFPGCNKSFSNSSDRSKHQKTHFDQKPYACMYPGCPKRYTDPSSLRKHAKTHQYQRKKPRSEDQPEEGLGECLTIQPLGRASAPSPANSSQSKHSSGSGSTKSSSSGETRKRSKVKVEADVTGILAHPAKHELHSFGLAGNPPSYFPPQPTQTFSSQLPNTSPHITSSPPTAGHAYSPPSQHGLGYPFSPKMATLSPASAAYPSAQASPSSCLYSSNPDSPMQVAFSPARPPPRLSGTDIYTHRDVVPTAYTTCHTSLPSSLSAPPDYIPSQPPPAYSEATGYGESGYELMNVEQDLISATNFSPQHIPSMLPGNEQAASNTDIISSSC